MCASESGLTASASFVERELRAHLPLGSLALDTTPSGPAWCPGGLTAQKALAAYSWGPGRRVGAWAGMFQLEVTGDAEAPGPAAPAPALRHLCTAQP